MARPGPAPIPLEKRFWQWVDMAAGTDGCWPWKGATAHQGYGTIKIDGTRKTRGSHRVAWELTNGPIVSGLWVLHRCDNPPCCNPAHLFLGTRADNIADWVRKARHAQKLNPQMVFEIRKRLDLGEAQTALAAKYGVRQGTISAIKLRRIWKEIR